MDAAPILIRTLRLEAAPCHRRVAELIRIAKAGGQSSLVYPLTLSEAEAESAVRHAAEKVAADLGDAE